MKKREWAFGFSFPCYIDDFVSSQELAVGAENQKYRDRVELRDDYFVKEDSGSFTVFIERPKR